RRRSVSSSARARSCHPTTRPPPPSRVLRQPGDIVLLSLYELGRPPLALAQAAGFLARAGFAPLCFDLAVRPLDDEVLAACARARLLAVSVPMHTALRLALAALPRLRTSSAHICFFGLYSTLFGRAPLHREVLGAVDSVLGGELEEELVALATRLETGG